MFNKSVQHIQLVFARVLQLQQGLNTVCYRLINSLFTQHIPPTVLIRPVINDAFIIELQFGSDFAWRPGFQIERPGGLSYFGRICHARIIRRQKAGFTRFRSDEFGYGLYPNFQEVNRLKGLIQRRIVGRTKDVFDVI
ncbi:hypothetical protein VPBB_2561 [Vibrio parahaemolyticus BB22OP]|nr:hypothetical protein VPBB_2561 [Vibrio parahaemolyticus BB22OP]